VPEFECLNLQEYFVNLLTVFVAFTISTASIPFIIFYLQRAIIQLTSRKLLTNQAFL
jgi:hypothetical protein